ncbi:alpha-mannosidase [Nocardia terpenica]|uniref:alpha-mannosidase n=1 Tax=Nocardia terpenica TaxID=455432 RepID=UPI001892E8EF|nr:glycoside hydrolase family 38 C-terminal domain-containing protein [Nocardia terpenica]MBF6063759.1 alpha-mannosidase [Nocardia terpenica]MBF6107135.1 alpha-mannosidase [Nocardia terpenica]MBF6114308.1 alpha-mannosidase [Nocardia terpenica]MBF6121605.1 alpha-mannosidase [Nocardia terpenica]MBF6154020.1 alpha-mannosidase [Nocardia terpenica]
MHDDRKLVEDRIFRILVERIRPAVYPESVPARIEVWHAPGEPVPVAEGLSAQYREATVGQMWGPPWATMWCRVTGEVPAAWAGRTVEAVIDLGFDASMAGFQCEGMVYAPDGTVIKGLSPRNSWVRIGAPAAGGERVELYVEAAANPTIFGGTAGAAMFRPTHLGHRDTAGDAPLYRISRVALAVYDTEVADLGTDIQVAVQLMRELPETGSRRWEILRAVERALDALDVHDVPGTAAAARAELADTLARPAHASAHRISAVGHAHIDSAWLWPTRETVRKVTRTVANVVDLLEHNPDFVFAMSQAQQLAWVKERAPELFARVAAQVAAGRFVPVGGMWVESDTNLPGGEALARQFVHGKRFFLDEFGLETEEVWLPDSFGYTAALPQLVAQSGSRWFLTQKICWNQINKFPHHTFWWEGLDGTRVFTHFPPVDTYNSELTGAELAHAERNFAEKGGATRSMVPFGYGDGGGGPTREMLARAARLRDLEGSPRVAVEAPAEFFRKAEAEYPHAPVWSGELYLELHRGTYTSQARTKQGNRRSEHLLREAELWAATAAVRHGAEYPYDELDRIWKTVLLNQFHDILPGSSIAWVHREAERDYAEIAVRLTEIIDAAQRRLAGAGADTVVFNAAPHARDGVAGLGAAAAAQPSGDPVLAEPADGGFVLTNGVLRVVVDGNGLLRSVYDLAAGREAIAPGSSGNLLQLHPDVPNNWDAWDVDRHYRNTVTDLTAADKVVLESTGPDRAAVTVVRTFGLSTVRQRLTVRAGERAIEIDTEVDWHETEKFLKLAFGLDVAAERSAAEIQFGHVHRPTHVNTSWEAARFEICAHRWMLLAESGYGVALANDSTYGHDVARIPLDGGGFGTLLRASLLRAPRFPDPDTDHGVHRFRHALIPGADVAAAVREGYRINLPVREVAGANAVAPLLTVDNPAVVIESVKLADDRSGDVVVRLYEAHGGRARARLTAGFPLAAAHSTDLLEREWARTEHYGVGGSDIELALRPFEIRTLRLSIG